MRACEAKTLTEFSKEQVEVPQVIFDQIKHAAKQGLYNVAVFLSDVHKHPYTDRGEPVDVVHIKIGVVLKKLESLGYSTKIDSSMAIISW